MEKSLFKRVGGTYHQEGDYFLPDLSIPELPAIGIWGQRRKRYLREHSKALYNALLFNGELNNHLADIEQQAEDMFAQLVKQITEQEGVTEQLKADNQMEWVGQINNIRERIIEIINANLIYQ